MFDHGLEQNVPVESIKITREGMHEHAINPTKSQREIEAQPPNEFVDDELSAEVKTESKKAKKDYDGDGKIESGKDEYFGSRDKAIKKAMGKKAMKKEETVEEGKKKGLWDNIHAKRKRGEKPAKKGDKDYPKTLNVEGDMKTARKNVGASTCWDGYKAKGTKKKGGKTVPNCVKEFSEWRKLSEKK